MITMKLLSATGTNWFQNVFERRKAAICQCDLQLITLNWLGIINLYWYCQGCLHQMNEDFPFLKHYEDVTKFLIFLFVGHFSAKGWNRYSSANMMLSSFLKIILKQGSSWTRMIFVSLVLNKCHWQWRETKIGHMTPPACSTIQWDHDWHVAAVSLSCPDLVSRSICLDYTQQESL